MRAILLILVLLSALGTPAHSRTQDAAFDDQDLGDSIVKGVATPQTLWLLGSSRNVVAFDRASGERRIVGTGVVDIDLEGEAVWALSQYQGDQAPLLLRDLRRPARPPEIIFAPGAPIAIHARGPHLFLVTSRAVATKRGRPWRVAAMEGSISSIRGHLQSNTRGDLFLGVDYGEWGGGLNRIVPRTGDRIPISDQIAPGPYCQGGLHCDAVAGIIPDTTSEDCVIVLSGINHMISRSRILRVCSTGVETLLREPANDSQLDRYFDSLALTSTGWIATAGGEALRATRGGRLAWERPSLREWSGIRINDEHPDILFVQGACCWNDTPGAEGYRLIAVAVEDAEGRRLR